MRDFLIPTNGLAHRRWTIATTICLFLTVLHMLVGSASMAIGIVLVAADILCVAAMAVTSMKSGLGYHVETKYDAEILNAHAMVTMVDLNGTVLAANANFCRVVGRSAKEVIGNNMLDLYYLEKDVSRYLEIQGAVKEGRKWSGEVRLKGQGGKEIWTYSTSMPTKSITGKITGAIMVRTDITDAKRASGVMELVKTFDNLADQVVVFSSPDGTIEYVNHSARKLFDFDSAMVGKLRMTDIELEYDTAHVNAQISRLMKEKLEYVDFVLSLKGTPFDVRVQSVESTVGQPQLIAFFRDRTHKEALEREKSQFVATVSHELRTPLTSIRGALGLAMSTGLENVPGKVQDLLLMAQRNAERLILIVNDILDLEKMDAGQMPFDLMPQDLRRVVDDAVKMNRPYFEELGVLVDVEGPSHPIMADVDADRMAQVLSNLLSNAAKFSQTGELVTVRIWEDEGTVGFSVTDRGAGIPAAELETIFERFRQAKNANRAKKGGTGLGLAIVETIMDRHRGFVILESSEGSGTTVHCNFPQSAGMSEEIGTAAVA